MPVPDSLVGEERREEVVDLRGGHALAVVADGQRDVGLALEFLERGAEAQRAAFRHGLGGVEDEVEQHLLDLRAVGAEERAVPPGALLRTSMPCLLQLVAREEEDVVDELLRRGPAP